MGISYHRFLFVTLAVIINFDFAFAEATPPAKAPPAAPAAAKAPAPVVQKKYASVAGLSGNSKTKGGVSCAIPIDSLDYVGMKFQGPYSCVDAKNDKEGIAACAPNLAVNPANPQYGQSKSGTRDTNPAGYYYCILKRPATVSDTGAQIPADAPVNDKKYMCEALAASQSSYRSLEGGANLTYTWRPAGMSADSDGDCMCGLSGEESFNCNTKPPGQFAIDKCGNLGLKNDETSPAGLIKCVCNDPPPTRRTFAPVDALKECAKPAAAVAAVAATASATTTVDPALKSCVESWLANSNKCKETADKAKKSCDEANNSNKGSNSNIKAASDVTGVLGNLYSSTHAGSGSQAECFRAGIIANTGSEAIKDMQTSCEIDYTDCNKSCKPDKDSTSSTKYDEYVKACLASMGSTVDLNSDTGPNGEFFRNNANTIKTNFESGVSTCTVDAKQKRSVLSSLLDGVGRALQASLQCVCQLSSAGGDCSQIPTVADCSAIPQPAGCGGYGAMDTCTPGSASYSASACNCMQNPGSVGCSGSSSNVVSSFAGPGISAGGGLAAGVSFGSGGGSGSRTGDLGSLNGVDPGGGGDLNFPAGAKISGGSVGGGGGGGGGLGGGNGEIAGEKPVIPAEEADKGIGGMFNQAKSFMSNALGLSKAKPGAAGNGTLGKGFNPNNFKPLRGLAGRTSGMGSRNMDIWKMMNSCTSGDTCKSNENNYIIGP